MAQTRAEAVAELDGPVAGATVARISSGSLAGLASAGRPAGASVRRTFRAPTGGSEADAVTRVSDRPPTRAVILIDTVGAPRE